MKTPSIYPLKDGYSLKRHVQDVLDSGTPTLGFEAEPHIRIKREFGTRATTTGDARLRVVYIPYSEFGAGRIGEERVLHLRDLGGSLYQTITGITPSYTTGLVSHSQVFKAGATLLEGLEGQIMLEGTTAIPQPAFSTATDGTTVTPQSDPTFVGGSVGSNSMIFSPLRLSFKTKISNQLLAQAARIFEPTLRNVIGRGISGMIDNLALFGSGTNGQPLGVYSTVTPVNLTTTPLTWTGTLPNGYTNYRELVRESDLDPDSYGVIISPAMENYLDSTQFASGASYTLLDKIKDGSPERVFTGNEINSSNPSGTKAMFIGLFRFLYVMLWGSGIEVSFDKWSSADTFETVVRANVLANVGISFPQAFQAIRQN